MLNIKYTDYSSKSQRQKKAEYINHKPHQHLHIIALTHLEITLSNNAYRFGLKQHPFCKFTLAILQRINLKALFIMSTFGHLIEQLTILLTIYWLYYLSKQP